VKFRIEVLLPNLAEPRSDDEDPSVHQSIIEIVNTLPQASLPKSEVALPPRIKVRIDRELPMLQ
jgi:hypothetical protein